MYFAVQMYKTLGPDLNRGDTLVPMPPNMDEITKAVISEQFQRRGTLSSFVSERCTPMQRSEATPIQDWRQAAAEYRVVCGNWANDGSQWLEEREP